MTEGAHRKSGHGQRLLISALLLLVGAHLALTLIEVLYQPVFPWDAWLNWMYRAKAWYLSGAIEPMDPVALWAADNEPNHRYAVAGHHYPTLLPRMAFAMATLTGGWSETAVNLPYVAAGIILAAGTYALGRDFGLGRVLALVAAYFVVSTPLIGAHLSLAGQADIWMAVTTGLGFASLFVGLARQRAGRYLAGLALIGLGTQFKVEGTVWLLAALLFTAVGLRPRFTLATGAALGAVLTILWLAGVHQLDLPLLGPAGVIDGRLYVPILGNYALQQHALADDYVSNFFLGGSWNLMWYLAAGAFVAALLRCTRDRVAALALAFFILTAAAQVLIFFFTEQGAWAEDWTAINRLPLHFVPALVLVSLACFFPEGDNDLTESADLGRTTLATVAGVALLLLVAIPTLILLRPGTDDLPFHRDGARLRAVMGAGVPEGDALAVRRFDANVALISSGPISVDAASAPLARVVSRGRNRNGVTFFWRLLGDKELYRTQLAGLGDLYVDLTGEANWKGRVTEIGMVFYDDGGSVRVESLSLHRPGLVTRFDQALTDWRWFAPWSQRSVNWVPGGNPRAHVALPLALCSIGILGVLIVAGRRRGKAYTSMALAGVFLALWALSDLRWLGRRAELAAAATQDYPLLSSDPLVFGDDARSATAVDRAVCDLRTTTRGGVVTASPLPRLLITSDSSASMRFQLLRGKYHALPVPAHAHERSPESLPLGLADRVLVLKLRYGRDNVRTYPSRSLAAQLTTQSGKRFRIAWESVDAYLLVSDVVDKANCWAENS